VQKFSDFFGFLRICGHLPFFPNFDRSLRALILIKLVEKNFRVSEHTRRMEAKMEHPNTDWPRPLREMSAVSRPLTKLIFNGRIYTETLYISLLILFPHLG
jgi:hypothetical protein